MKSKFNNLFKQILTENKINLYNIKKYIKINKSAKYIPDIINSNLPFINIKQTLIWQNIHNFNKYLIKQAPSYEADYGNTLLDNISNCQNGQLFTKNDLLNLIPKTWCYYSLFQNSQEIIFYVYKFDFQNCQTKTFSLVDKLKKIYLPQQLNIFTQQDIQHHKIEYANAMSMTTGNLLPPIYSNILNQKVTYLCLNINSDCHFNKTTINHQLFHYMQNVLNMYVLSEEELNLDVIQSQISYILKEINLSQEYFYQYINTAEFWTYIHTNMIDFLEILFKILNKQFPQISKQLLIKKLIIDIESNKNEIYNKALYLMQNYETNMLKFLRAIYLLYQSTLWKDVKELLKKNFK